MLPELTQQEYATALDAADVLCALSIDGPPVDAIELAQAMGLSIAWDATQRGRGRIVRPRRLATRGEQGSILLRPEPRRERLQWAIAHEIGETCAHRAFDQLSVDPREAPPGARETVANQLAGRLLLPAAWFLQDGRVTRWDLFELKARYATASRELIARRMLDFEPPIAIAVFDHRLRTFRRGNMPGRLPALLPLEQLAWHTVHEHALPATEADATCLVQAWPVHEPDWKREILRTEWHDSDEAMAF